MERSTVDSAFLLSRFFAYPDEAFCEAVLSGEAVLQLRAALEGLPGWADADSGLKAEVERSAEAVGRRYERVAPADSFHAMRVECTTLLNGMPKPAVQPFESVFRGQAAGRRVLIMVDDVAEQVRSCYKRAGVVAQNPSEPVDHVSVELEFLGLLADRGDTEACREFFEEHCASWMPEFADALWHAAGEGSYLRFAAACLSAFVDSGLFLQARR